MHKPSEQALPTKCTHCSKQMSTPIVCDFCKSVNPEAMGTDYFTLLGLPRKYNLDEKEIHRKYLALNRHAHPDFHANDTQEVQNLHLHVSATLNDAYRTLKDPAGRADYLLELLGGKSLAEDKSVPDGFLPTMMMLQEEIADANSADDSQELERLSKVLQTQHDGLTNHISELFDEYQQGVACQAIREGLLGEIRKQLNAISYVRKLLSQV